MGVPRSPRVQVEVEEGAFEVLVVSSAEAVCFPAGASICVVEVVVPGEGFAEEGAILREGKSSVVGCDSPRLSGPAAAGAPCCWAACLDFLFSGCR